MKKIGSRYHTQEQNKLRMMKNHYLLVGDEKITCSILKEP